MEYALIGFFTGLSLILAFGADNIFVIAVPPNLAFHCRGASRFRKNFKPKEARVVLYHMG